MEGRKPCLKCLLAELDYDEYTQSLLDYIKKVPADRRVSEEVYQSRLAQCRSCEKLINGMCAECGCYVELRALKSASDCAAPVKRWTSQTDLQ
ncbi:MAG: hypothetical protein IKO27_05310 [Ruminococcus sp.]|nr:hypothetical protein [Ruminococcus sp.]